METFPGVVMVNSVDESGTLASTSDVMDGNVAVLSYGANVLKPINYVAEGDNRVGNGGTSTAAAVLSSYLALAMQKWPDATGQPDHPVFDTQHEERQRQSRSSTRSANAGSVRWT